MRSAIVSVAFVAFGAGLVFGCGCSSGSGGRADGGAGSGGSGSGGGNGSDLGGDTPSGGGSGGMPGSGGTGSGGTTGSGGAGGANPDAVSDSSSTLDSGGPDGTNADTDIIKVVRTSGCGSDPGQAVGIAVRGTIQTMGTKPAGCADSKCGDWSYEREYFVTLPQGYDRTKAYPLVLQASGCMSTGLAVYPLNNNVGETVIRVGLTPPPNAIGHATNPGQGCFDDKEGDDSVDWVFYENLHDKLAGQLCFDRNRVFASGNSSGGWFANELGCKYAGDATRPIRGILTVTATLPTQPQYVPTCTSKPMAGMWVWEINDFGSSFVTPKVAINRAMKVNGCTIGTTFDDTQFDPFPIGGGNPATTCRKIQGCPDLYPLVTCMLQGPGLSPQDNIANPGFSTFIRLFSTPPLLTP